MGVAPSGVLSRTQSGRRAVIIVVFKSTSHLNSPHNQHIHFNSINFKSGFNHEQDMRIIIGFLLVLTVFLAACSITGAPVVDPNDPCTQHREESARDWCYYEANKCSKVQSDSLRDSCVVELAKIKDDPEVCDLVQTPKTQSYCHQQLAILHDNWEECRDIEDRYWQDNCWYHFGIQGNQEDFCGNIDNTPQQLRCVKKVAYETNDVELCQRLSFKEATACVFHVAKELQDISKCNVIEKLNGKDSCILAVAKVTKDESLCEEISYDLIRKTCYDRINN